jgi:arabinose-5-phosphate isomerase
MAMVLDLMHSGDAIPLVKDDSIMSDVLIEMSAKSFGCVGVLNGSDNLIGIITDGDLRRHMGSDLVNRPASEIMTANPKVGSPDMLAADAMREMTAGANKIMQLFILDQGGKPAGILHLHDLLRAGLK